MTGTRSGVVRLAEDLGDNLAEDLVEEHHTEILEQGLGDPPVEYTVGVDMGGVRTGLAACEQFPRHSEETS